MGLLYLVPRDKIPITRWLILIFNLKKEDIAIEYIKTKKIMTYRKPRLRINANKVSKALNGTGKFIADQHSEMNEHTYRKINVMSTQQEINFLLASSSLAVRRVRSGNKAHARLVANGKEDGLIRTAYEWMVDYLIVTAELIWMIIRTILMFFWMLIYRVLLIVFFTAVVFYLIYLFFTL